MVNIELATLDDLDAINLFRRKLYTEVSYGCLTSEYDLSTLIQEYNSASNKYYYIAKKGDDVVGQIYFTIENGLCELSNISVLRSQYGTGLAKRLLLVCDDKTIEHNCDGIKTIVDFRNSRAVNFYKTNGFKFLEVWAEDKNCLMYHKSIF